MVFQSTDASMALAEEYRGCKFNGQTRTQKLLPGISLADRGTENGLMAAMQCYLCANHQDEFSRSKAHQYLSSPRNQRIECY